MWGLFIPLIWIVDSISALPIFTQIGVAWSSLKLSNFDKLKQESGGMNMSPAKTAASLDVIDKFGLNGLNLTSEGISILN